MGELKRGTTGVITLIAHSEPAICQRLMEMGLLEGSRFEIVHEAPFGGDPIAIRVRGALIAVRRLDANQIEVET